MAGRTYASAASSGSGHSDGNIQSSARAQNNSNVVAAASKDTQLGPHHERGKDGQIRRRSPSPSQQPRTGGEEENVYILTLLTDKEHHVRMTQLRNKYFPKRINKLAAHLTLFHALPGTKLESNIIPTVQDVASKTQQFRITAAKSFKLKHGIAIAVPHEAGGGMAKQIRSRLQRPWKEEGFLSQQDSGGDRLHYTIMNKVEDEEEIDRAFEEVKKDFKSDEGVVEGLGLYRYDRGFWRWVRKFEFQQRHEDMS